MNTKRSLMQIIRVIRPLCPAFGQHFADLSPRGLGLFIQRIDLLSDLYAPSPHLPVIVGAGQRQHCQHAQAEHYKDQDQGGCSRPDPDTVLLVHDPKFSVKSVYCRSGNRAE